MSSDDHYKVLGVERTADEAAIKSAYRKLAKEFHPDKVRGLAVKAGKEGAALDAAIQEGQQAFQRIGAAYDVLGDTAKRANYDRYGHAGVQAAASAARRRPGGASASGTSASHDPFEDIFGKGWRERTADPFGQHTRSGAHAGTSSTSSHGPQPGEGARASSSHTGRTRSTHDFMHDAEEFTHRYEGSALRRALMTFDVVDVVLLGAIVIGGIRQWREATKKEAPIQPTAQPAAEQPAAAKPWSKRIEDEPVPMYKQRTF